MDQLQSPLPAEVPLNGTGQTPPIYDQPPSTGKKPLLIGGLILLSLIIITGAIYVGMKIGEKNQSQTPSTTKNLTSPTKTQSNPTAIPTTDPTLGWKTYKNNKYNFSIKYPPDWVFREYPSTLDGAGFRPANKSSDPLYEIINVKYLQRALYDKSIPFNDYVKIAAIHSIQSYNKLNSIKEIKTKNDLIGYETTWYVTAFGNSPSHISQPITYFDTNDFGNGIITISLDNEADNNVYEQMISTFKFL